MELVGAPGEYRTRPSGFQRRSQAVRSWKRTGHAETPKRVFRAKKSDRACDVI
jgi:hypothetical protein